MITKEELQKKSEYVQCEGCDSYMHYKQAATDDGGCHTCPECMRSYHEALIKMYKDLMRELADPELREIDIQNRADKAIADLHGINVEDLEHLFE